MVTFEQGDLLLEDVCLNLVEMVLMGLLSHLLCLLGQHFVLSTQSLKLNTLLLKQSLLVLNLNLKTTLNSV